MIHNSFPMWFLIIEKFLTQIMHASQALFASMRPTPKFSAPLARKIWKSRGYLRGKCCALFSPDVVPLIGTSPDVTVGTGAISIQYNPLIRRVLWTNGSFTCVACPLVPARVLGTAFSRLGQFPHASILRGILEVKNGYCNS